MMGEFEQVDFRPNGREPMQQGLCLDLDLRLAAEHVRDILSGGERHAQVLEVLGAALIGQTDLCLRHVLKSRNFAQT